MARSPFYMHTPVEKRKNSKLYIYAGIHDGYEGSVPISQSLAFYNKVVADFDQAIEHIEEYGSGHTEVIVSQDYSKTQAFIRRVNSAVVMANASSRFSDGGQLGLGAEIGISTSKLHAYGPMGAESLTTEKFIVMGDGEVRS